MQLFVIIRRSADVFIAGMIESNNVVEVDNHTIKYKSMSIQIFNKISSLKDVNLDQYRPLRQFVNDCVENEDIVTTEFINRIKNLARAKQIWVHNKSTLAIRKE